MSWVFSLCGTVAEGLLHSHSEGGKLGRPDAAPDLQLGQINHLGKGMTAPVMIEDLTFQNHILGAQRRCPDPVSCLP